MKTRLVTKTLLASAVTLALGSAIAAPYEIVDLGNLGGDESHGWGINAQGTVVGFANGPLVNGSETERDFNFHGFSSDGIAKIDLGAFGENSSYALKINDLGTIIGYAFDEVDSEALDDDGNTIIVSVLEQFAVVFDGNGVVNKVAFDLPIRDSRAVDLNNNDVIVGFGALDISTEGDSASFANRGFIVNQDLSIEYLPVLGDDQAASFDSYATSVNDNGIVIGWSEKLADDGFAVGAAGVVYNFTSELIELPTLGGRETYANDINNNNIIVGRSQDSTGFFKSYIYDLSLATGSLVELPYFGDTFRDSVANAVNNNNQVVGNSLVSSFSTPKYAGYIYEAGEFKQLNDLVRCDSGWDLQLANDINDSGEITGIGIFQSEIRAYKLIPTGEAIEDCDTNTTRSSGGSWTWLSLSLLGLFALRRKFK